MSLDSKTVYDQNRCTVTLDKLLYNSCFFVQNSFRYLSHFAMYEQQVCKHVMLTHPNSLRTDTMKQMTILTPCGLIQCNKLLEDTDRSSILTYADVFLTGTFPS